MKKLIFLALFVVVGGSLFLGSLDYSKAAHEKQPELFTRLTSATPFDFPQQWRKTKKDSDEWIRSKERFNSRMQGITPLWACVYSRDTYTTLNPIIRAANDGGLIVGCTHHVNPGGGTFTCIAKLSSDSSVEWQLSYNTSYFLNRVKCIEHTMDGGFIVAILGYLGDGFLILKLSAEGNTEWVNSYRGYSSEAPYYIKQTSDGGYIVVGVTTTFTNPEYIGPDWIFEVDLLVIKLSSAGNIEWQSAFGGPKFETDWLGKTRSATIVESRHGGYLVVCDTPSFSNNENKDIWVVKLSDFGDIEWQRVFGGEKDELLLNPGPHAIETTDGKYIIACHTWSYGLVDPSANFRYSDVWIIKLKPNGNIEWQKTYGEIGADTVFSILATDNGGCIVAGASNSWASSVLSDFWVFKISSKGNIIWQHTYGGELWDEATSVCITSDNGLAIAGSTLSFENEYEDLLVLKLTSDGKLDNMCSNLVKDSNAVVMDTYAVPLDTYEVARVADAKMSTPNFIKEEIDLEKRAICWNFNQPPVNVSFERMENNSFFVSEVWHTITWNPDPYNSNHGFAIAEYNIYRKEREDVDDDYSAYQHIATVSANIFIFEDKNVQSDMQYLYAVTAIDSEGNESPKSDSVGNLN